jgi:hypothetical protein
VHRKKNCSGVCRKAIEERSGPATGHYRQVLADLMDCSQERLVRIATQNARSVYSTLEETVGAWEREASVAESSGTSTRDRRGGSGVLRLLTRLAGGAGGGRGGGAGGGERGVWARASGYRRGGEDVSSSENDDISVTTGAHLVRAELLFFAARAWSKSEDLSLIVV